jgi:hypothetical protein
MDSEDLVCGVQRKLVEEFLCLIRDNYRKAERAIFFLEEHGHMNYAAPIANLRDATSHLASMLDPKTPPANKRAQLENAEEHLRRAILEPYLIVFGRERKVFRQLYARYQEELLPSKNRYPTLANAPERGYVMAQLHRIVELASLGRAAKATNLWNPEWERGVSALVDANAILSDLHSQVKEHWNEYQRILRDDELRKDLAEFKARFEKESAFLTSQRGTTSPASTNMLKVVNLVERSLRKVVHLEPTRETDVQNAFESLLVGAEVIYLREADTLSYSSKVYIPDFTIGELDLAIEVKLCNRKGREAEIIGEINDDILAYKTRFGNLLFVVYDMGFIRDAERFSQTFEKHQSVMVRIVKN